MLEIPSCCLVSVEKFVEEAVSTVLDRFPWSLVCIIRMKSHALDKIFVQLDTHFAVTCSWIYVSIWITVSDSWSHLPWKNSCLKTLSIKKRIKQGMCLSVFRAFILPVYKMIKSMSYGLTTWIHMVWRNFWNSARTTCMSGCLTQSRLGSGQQNWAQELEI